MQRFMEYGWPGNLRELRSALEFAFVLADGDVIDLDQLPPKIADPTQRLSATEQMHSPADDRETIRNTKAFSTNTGNSTEKEALIEALKKANGNQS